MTTYGVWYVGAAAAMLWLIARTGSLGRAVAHVTTWGVASLALYLMLASVGAPPALVVPANPYTVGAAALLGPPGIGIAILAHALYR